MDLIQQISKSDPELAEKLYRVYQEIQWAGMQGKGGKS